MKCKTCGKNADSEYCFAHKSKKPLPSSGKGLITRMSSISNKKFNNVQNNKQTLSKRTSKQLSKEIEKKLTTHKMFEFFISYWKKSDKKSALSGKFLGKEPMSTYFHHILAKEKYPEACLDEENIILLTLEEHNNVENDMYRYEEINKRREQLKIKYNL
jgi:hypothetical protein